MKYLWILIFLSSCALFRRPDQKTLNKEKYHQDIHQLKSLQEKDFIEQYKFLGQRFIEEQKKKKKYIYLSNRVKDYIQRFYSRVVHHNELIYETQYSPQLHVIQSNVPFYFSLPGGFFCVSSILIKDYLDSEKLFRAMMAYMIFQSQRELYKKREFYPIDNEQLLMDLHDLSKIDLTEKMEIYTWVYWTMERSGMDGRDLLSFIQIQNRHSLEFSFQNGRTGQVFREEFYFKNFLASLGVRPISKRERIFEANTEFYELRELVQ